MRHIYAIFWKQCKDTLKNKAILLQFILFPVITIIMENAISIQDMPEHFFANLFSTMYIGMAALVSISTIISEENEKGTLKVLRLSNVKSFEYLLGNSIYILTFCMIGSLIMGLTSGYAGTNLLYFMIIMLIGHIFSILIGASIGVICKNQMKATSMSLPIMMIFSLVPMLSNFNNTIKSIGKFIFTEQLYMYLNDLPNFNITFESGIILLCNFILIITIFIYSYKKVFRKNY